MILNWYLDTDGESHRLYAEDDWSDTVLGAVSVPADGVTPFGSVDSADLVSALREVAATLGAETSADVEPRMLTISTGTLGPGQDVLAISGRHGETAAYRTVPWEPVDAPPRLLAITSSGELTAFDPPEGRCQVSLGADADWTATLVLAGPAGRDRLRMVRTSVPTLGTTLVQEERGLVGATVEKSALARLVDAVSADEQVTLAVVPDRMLVRTNSGMLGSLPASISGAPQQGSFGPDPIRRVLSRLSSSSTHVHVELTGDMQRPSVRIREIGREAVATVLHPGWSYR